MVLGDTGPLPLGDGAPVYPPVPAVTCEFQSLVLLRLIWKYFF